MKNTKVDMIRAWKDAEYRSSLSAEQLAAIEKMPVMSEVDQEMIKGGDYVNTVSAECSSSGRGCNTGRGIYDQIGDWIFN